MKKSRFILIFLLSLLLCACEFSSPQGDASEAISDVIKTESQVSEEPTYSENSAVSDESTESETPTVSEESDVSETPTVSEESDESETPTVSEESDVSEEPTHSEFYLEGYSAQQIIDYFSEVALDMEYSDGLGDTTLIQKWLSPISYRIDGEPEKDDIAVLNGLFEQLNEIAGFPGIHPAKEGEPANMTLGFLEKNDFNDSFSDVVNGEDAFGAAQFWYYTATNEIHTARIGYRTDMDEDSRTSVLVEEIVNSLGISDTVLRTDSVVYQYSNDNSALSEVDILILKLLYHPEIKCGMNAADCETVIRKLYY